MQHYHSWYVSYVRLSLVTCNTITPGMYRMSDCHHVTLQHHHSWCVSYVRLSSCYMQHYHSWYVSYVRLSSCYMQHYHSWVCIICQTVILLLLLLTGTPQAIEHFTSCHHSSVDDQLYVSNLGARLKPRNTHCYLHVMSSGLLGQGTLSTHRTSKLIKLTGNIHIHSQLCSAQPRELTIQSMSFATHEHVTIIDSAHRAVGCPTRHGIV